MPWWEFEWVTKVWQTKIKCSSNSKSNKDFLTKNSNFSLMSSFSIFSIMNNEDQPYTRDHSDNGVEIDVSWTNLVSIYGICADYSSGDISADDVARVGDDEAEDGYGTMGHERTADCNSPWKWR